MGVTASNYCAYCDEIDFVEHFFFECSKVQQLWKEIEKQINAHCGARQVLDAQSVLLGITTSDKLSTKTLKTLNHMILVGKMSISKMKYGKGGDLLVLFENECSYRKILL